MGFHSYLLVIWSVITTWTVINSSENIALGKATNQSSVLLTWDSSKAVDGCTSTTITSNCCTHTAEGQTEAWWQVDLQTESVIETVNIIYRDDGVLNRLGGYEIYLSNTSDWTSGTRCHKDTTADLASLSAIQNVTCPGIARYLTIYNDRRIKAKTWYSDDAYLELCEVQVYGCPVGKYGSGNCNNDCLNCLGNICDPTSGTCGCPVGKYGSGNCNNDCLNCLGNICDPTSGTCDICAAEYYAVDRSCVPCPVNCVGSKCDIITGTCSDGCVTGFSGVYCRCPVNCKDVSCPNGRCSDCIDGYYGPTCMPCPSGCSTDTCDKTSGYCVQCDVGFYDSFCTMSCPVNCRNNVCNKDNGQCIDCIDGYYGPTCMPCPDGCSTDTCDKTSGYCVRCDAGFYDRFCNMSCPVNCQNNTCNKDNGQCIECDAGFYGRFCRQTCPVNCKDSVCTMDNGHCIECVNGLHGSFCIQPCPAHCKQNVCTKDIGHCIECDIGFYGNFCNLSCPRNCENNVCNKDNGQCTVCEAGFHGDQCLKSCGNCLGVSCDKETGDCGTGCTDGWTGDTCDTKVVIVMDKDAAVQIGVGLGVGLGIVILALVIVIIVLIKRLRMKREDTTNSTNMTDISSSRTAKELNKDQDDNYAEIVTNRDQSIAQDSHTDGNYEKLGRRDVTIPHVYETTNR